MVRLTDLVNMTIVVDRVIKPPNKKSHLTGTVIAVCKTLVFAFMKFILAQDQDFSFYGNLGSKIN